MVDPSYLAIYDFGLFPYALGDVLTWNIQTAIRCEELGRSQVDIYLCVDGKQPANYFQLELVNTDNCDLIFNELLAAFGMHPKIGNIFIYRQRDQMVLALREACGTDTPNSKVLGDYEAALGDYQRILTAGEGTPHLMLSYFSNHVTSHDRINSYAAAHGSVPLLRPSLGCGPDVSGLLTKRFARNRIVTVHMRLRRLDAGYGGSHTYARDSDFVEWYEFLRDAEKHHPDVQFVVMGRLQEKPLELLRLPNVLSLRALGLGLGHELTLLMNSDLFIGASSGFAAVANFSKTPCFITKMDPGACRAYGIAPGSARLPFTGERQILVHEPETRDLLLQLLERGLRGVPPRNGPSGGPDAGIDPRSWEWEQSRWLHPGATTHRFFTDDGYREKETAFLVWPAVREAAAARKGGQRDQAWTMLDRLDSCFPSLCAKFPDFLSLRATLALERNNTDILTLCNEHLAKLGVPTGLAVLTTALRRGWRRSYGARKRVWQRLFGEGVQAARPTPAGLASYIWNHRHKIPGKLRWEAKKLLRWVGA